MLLVKSLAALTEVSWDTVPGSAVRHTVCWKEKRKKKEENPNHEKCLQIVMQTHTRHIQSHRQPCKLIALKRACTHAKKLQHWLPSGLSLQHCSK